MKHLLCDFVYCTNIIENMLKCLKRCIICCEIRVLKMYQWRLAPSNSTNICASCVDNIHATNSCMFSCLFKC